jgi:hypothetical protein
MIHLLVDERIILLLEIIDLSVEGFQTLSMEIIQSSHEDLIIMLLIIRLQLENMQMLETKILLYGMMVV